MEDAGEISDVEVEATEEEEAWHPTATQLFGMFLGGIFAAAFLSIVFGNGLPDAVGPEIKLSAVFAGLYAISEAADKITAAIDRQTDMLASDDKEKQPETPTV